MGNLRFILFLSLSMVLLMLWQAWQEDYSATTDDTQAQGVALDIPNVPKSKSPFPSTNISAPESWSSNASVVDTKNSINVITDRYSINIDKEGGGITRVELLGYPVSLKTPDQPTLLMSDIPPLFYIFQGGLLSEGVDPTHKVEFSSERNNYTMRDSDDQLQVPLLWETDDGLKIYKIYQFTRDSYLINIRYQIENQGVDDWIGHAYSQLQRSEPGRTSNLFYTYTGAVISTPEKRYEKISFGDMEDENIAIDIVDGWLALLQHYFVSALIPSDSESPYHYYTLMPQDNRYVIGMITPQVQIESGATATLEQKLYIGPKVQSRLAEIAPGLELTVDYGILWFLAKPLFWCLEKFHSYTGNWGWSIILVTLMVKLIFFPFSAAGYRSMANMRRVSPRLLTIRDRYKDDRMKLNQAMMKLYKEEKINPLGGCLPILIQLPVFLALYWTLLESVELRQSAFIFWIKDLSTPDPFYVLPLIMGATMLIQQKLNPAPIDPIQQKIMTVLPIAFTIFFAFFPSGLVLYWVVNNVLSILQQWVINRKIDRVATQLRP